MNLEKRSLQVGAVAVVCAILLRMSSGGFLGGVVEALTSPEAVAAILYLETGRVVRLTQPQPSTEPTEPSVTEQLQPNQEPTQPQQEEPAQAVFAEDDAALVEVNSVCGYDADLPTLLKHPLSWDLTQEEPTVLILHTHGTESYTKTEDYVESSSYRTLDEGYNVVSVGNALAQTLEAGGIKVVHDTTLHDYPSYSDSYNHARDYIEKYLEQYPSISLVLDIHRDAVEDSDGQQVQFTTQVSGQTSAQLMMVVGTDAGGLTHPDWPENMSLAVKLHAQLEKNCPGICRPISFRSQRFNQDMSPGALIVEVGAAGNTRQEALLAAQLLGQAILDLSYGTAPS